MTLKEKIKQALDETEKTSFTQKQLCELLGAYGEEEEIVAVMDELCRDGVFVREPKSKKFKKVDGELFVTGVVQGNAKGFGFLVDEKGVSPDLFIPRANMHGALHKDRVVARRLDAYGDEAEVVQILQRGMTRIVGVMQRKGRAFVIPDEKRFSRDVFVPLCKTMGAKHNQKVVAEITSYPIGKNPEGQVVKILGYPSDKDSDMLSVACRFGIDDEFSPEAAAAARQVMQTVDAAAKANRRDFTHRIVFTVDGADAKDLDDAVSIEKKPDGTYLLGVHIADVSHYVAAGSALDKDAFERGTSVYFPSRVFPMLPKELSNGICSLNPCQERLTMSCLMQVDGKGNVIDSEICEGVIKTVRRMTYDDVFAMMQGDEQARAKFCDIAADVDLMKELALILIAKRERRGCMDFETKEVRFELDDNGKVLDVVPLERNLAHKMIEEFMILANETVAQTMFHMGLPFVYRVHEKPSPDKIADLADFLHGFGLNLGERAENVHSTTLQKVLKAAQGKPFEHIVSRVMLRSMQKAKYSSSNTGHFGLSSDCYCHFTSPIRRYPDLVVHRALKNLLHDCNPDFMAEFVGEASAQAGARELAADEAERFADDVKKAQYARDRLGCEFDGIVSGVTQFGVFVELPNTVEGLIRLENLPADNYAFDKKNFALNGAKHKFVLGKKVRIIIAAADICNGKIDFDFVSVL